MIESLAVTVFPSLFLIVLFGGGQRFRSRNIDMDGEAPIDRTLFLSSKYSILVLWGAMVLQSWGVNVSFINAPVLLKLFSLFLWFLGFVLLLAGRFGLGESFRIGSPRENTGLKVRGLFRVSRNPMYLGVYATIAASVLYTLNPICLAVGMFIVAVHHKIVLAEERHLEKMFGNQYLDYCRRVRRYL